MVCLAAGGCIAVRATSFSSVERALALQAATLTRRLERVPMVFDTSNHKQVPQCQVFKFQNSKNLLTVFIPIRFDADDNDDSYDVVNDDAAATDKADDDEDDDDDDDGGGGDGGDDNNDNDDDHADDNNNDDDEDDDDDDDNGDEDDDDDEDEGATAAAAADDDDDNNFVGSQKGGFLKGWFWRMIPPNENQNESTFGCSPGTKTGTRVRAHVPPERKPELEHVRQNHPFTEPPFYLPMTI